jgi:hypothetical protein
MKRLKPQTVNFEQISQFLSGAEKKLASARKVFAVDEEAAYQLAYEAMLKGSLGFMLSHGVRPRTGPGHHITIIEFSEKHLGEEFKSLISMFNRMRRKRTIQSMRSMPLFRGETPSKRSRRPENISWLFAKRSKRATRRRNYSDIKSAAADFMF